MLQNHLTALKYNLDLLKQHKQALFKIHAVLKSAAAAQARVFVYADHALRFKAMHLYEELVVRYKAGKDGLDRQRIPSLLMSDPLMPGSAVGNITEKDLVIAFIGDLTQNQVLQSISPKQLVLISDDQSFSDKGLAGHIQLNASTDLAVRSAIFSLCLHLLCEAYEQDSPQDPINEAISELHRILEDLVIDALEEKIRSLSKSLYEIDSQAASVYLIGNGGSACDALEFCSALRESRPNGIFPAYHFLDPSLLTCAYNDGYSPFKRAVEQQVTSKDLLIAYSTSGNSKNILEAIEQAKLQSAPVFAMTSKSGQLIKQANDSFAVVSKVTARIQELHAFFAELACSYLRDLYRSI